MTGLAGTGFIIGLNNACNEAPKVANLSEVKQWFEFTPYVNIADNGIVTIFNTKPEIGQGVYQSIPAIVCEELEVPLEKRSQPSKAQKATLPRPYKRPG